MRELERPAIDLPTLCGSGKGAQEAAAVLRLRAANPNARLEFPDHWNENDVRGALHAMQGFACAYCWGALDERDRGQVDHIRPKLGGPPGGYFWLAYEFSNFLLACAWCNRCKGNRFPIEPGTEHVTYETRKALDTEARLLADPTRDPVSRWFDVVWQNKERCGDIEVHRSLGAGSIERKRAEKTLKTFKLNLDIALLRARIRAIRASRPGIDAGERTMLKKLACRYLPQGAVVYAFLRDCRPEFLPTPQEEVFVLLEELLDSLRLAYRIRKTTRDAQDAIRRSEQICWAFAVIWTCPPRQALSPAEVAAWLEDHRLTALIKPLHRKFSAD